MSCSAGSIYSLYQGVDSFDQKPPAMCRSCVDVPLQFKTKFNDIWNKIIYDCTNGQGLCLFCLVQQTKSKEMMDCKYNTHDQKACDKPGGSTNNLVMPTRWC